MSWFLFFSHLIQHMESQSGLQVLILEKKHHKEKCRVVPQLQKWEKITCLKLELLWKSCLYNFHIPDALTETNNFHPWQMDGWKTIVSFFYCLASWQVGNSVFNRECNKPESNLFFKLEILPRDPGMVPKKPLFWRIHPYLSSFWHYFLRDF